jgi:hypothetical protein
VNSGDRHRKPVYPPLRRGYGRLCHDESRAMPLVTGRRLSFASWISGTFFGSSVAANECCIEAEKGNPVAAGFLAVIHRLVGLFQQRLRRLRVHRKARDTDRRADPRFFSARNARAQSSEVRLGDARAQSLCAYDSACFFVSPSTTQNPSPPLCATRSEGSVAEARNSSASSRKRASPTA